MSSNIFSLRVAVTNSDEAVPVVRFPYIENLIIVLFVSLDITFPPHTQLDSYQSITHLVSLPVA